ncbi:MAG: 5'-nucleotidase, partial [Ottowia sp.]|nr:5'-nucleotidase [Ottowia sp.]
FLGGLPKGEFLREFGADFFFDDHIGNVRGAAASSVPSGHVAAGVHNP